MAVWNSAGARATGVQRVLPNMSGASQWQLAQGHVACRCRLHIRGAECGQLEAHFGVTWIAYFVQVWFALPGVGCRTPFESTYG